MSKYNLQASGSNTCSHDFERLGDLEAYLKDNRLPGFISIIRYDLTEEVASGTQSQIIQTIPEAKQQGLEDLQGWVFE
jgi:hypothetical protein